MAAWPRLLLAVPDSRLMLKDRALADAKIRELVLADFAAHGVAERRLVLEAWAPDGQYSLYRNVDLALDPFPYNGTTTSLDALWMGVPFVTLAGRHAAARTGASLLLNAGLPQLVAPTVDDYIAVAAALAMDLPALRRMRQGLRENLQAGPLMDAPRFARNFEAALLGMWQAGDVPHRYPFPTAGCCGC